ncbi:MAG: Fur family transcriptional regulator [Kiritimatiellae bacterium]|nr:Fur family transcriptional regulator [Kiritimatiellia bacterium]
MELETQQDAPEAARSPADDVSAGTEGVRATREGQAFRKRCALTGLRVTQQRVAVFESLAACKDHPDAEQLHARVARAHPSLSMNTVYRTLGTLVDRGLVLRVACVGSTARFDACTEAHDHFYCIVCNRVLDLNLATAPAGVIPDAVREVGDVKQVQTLYVGVCHHCRK